MNLNDLLNTLEVSKEKFGETSISAEEFEKNFIQLDNIVGFDNALDILKNGEFFKYCSFKFNDYLNLVREVAGKMDYNIFDVSIFYSIQSLEKYMHTETDSTLSLDNINISEYKLLSCNSEQTDTYFINLIGGGELIVGDNDHWTNSNLPNGPRGTNILKIIKNEISHIFSNLELEKPKIELNYGSKYLRIDKETQNNLKQIYNKLKK